MGNRLRHLHRLCNGRYRIHRGRCNRSLFNQVNIMSMILDENGYERMRAHQRAASRAAVSRADENERLRERIKELEAEVNRWKPRPMSEAPKASEIIIA